MSVVDVVLLSSSSSSGRNRGSASLSDHESVLARARSLFASRALPTIIDLPTTMNDVTAIEHPTLKVPYEILNKKFRSAQKNIDREVSHVQNAVSDLEKGCKKSLDSKVTVGAISDLLSGVIDKLTVLKRKAHDSIADELEAASNCKKRLDHVKEYCSKKESSSPSDVVVVNAWKKKRLDRVLVEHLLRCGFYDTAVKLAKQSDILHLTNIDLFLTSREVEEALRKRDTSKCLAWCYDNKSKLRKQHSNLELNVRTQEVIELIRSGQRKDAVEHARKYLSPHVDPKEPSTLEDLQHCMTLLAFGPNTHVKPYSHLLDESRWEKLIAQFRDENVKLFQLSCTSVFWATLQCGLSSLKTPQCYRRDEQGRVQDCPVCSPLMNQLANNLPCAHASQSRLVCSASGQPLNEHNQPMMLPNGYVYGSIALQQMAEQNKGKVTCPRTKRVFDYSQCQKVFVM